MTAVSRLWLAAVAVLAIGFAARADEPDPRSIAIDEIRNPAPTFHVRVAVDHPDRTYKEGEVMKVNVHSDLDAYLYLFYVTAEKKTLLLFPNFVQKDNKIPAGKQVDIPAADARFRMRVAAPFGKEVLLAVLTRQPLKVKGLEVENLTKKEVNEIDFAKVKEAHAALKDAPSEWAEHSIELTTVAASAPPPPAARPEKRVGLFVGVGRYSCQKIPQVPVCSRGCRDVAQMMKERCGLDEEPIVVPDEKATRANLEELITKKLPVMTKPGDTVIIFWNGHGDPVPLPNGKIEHCLMLNETNIPDLPKNPTPDDMRKLYDAILATSLPSDTLKRWLQALDGRRLVLIVEACFSGGLHEQTKSAGPAGRALDLGDEPFLGGLVATSRALDQKDLILLASSTEKQPSAIRPQQDYGLFTYYLLELLKSGQQPLTMADLYEKIRWPVTAYVGGGRDRLVTILEARLRQLDQLIKAETNESNRKNLETERASLSMAVAQQKLENQTPVLAGELTAPFYIRPAKTTK
jgi:hypothetical protein